LRNLEEFAQNGCKPRKLQLATSKRNTERNLSDKGGAAATPASTAQAMYLLHHEWLLK
jgi:hypothetical protein